MARYQASIVVPSAPTAYGAQTNAASRAAIELFFGLHANVVSGSEEACCLNLTAALHCGAR